MTGLAETTHLLNRGHSSAKHRVHFCSRCGTLASHAVHAPRGPGGKAPLERVCRDCGMGVLLTCSRAALDWSNAAFLIVTADLRVSAVSVSAEPLFGREQDLVGSTLLASVRSPIGEEELAAAVARAASGGSEIARIPVTAATRVPPHVRPFSARVAACGPPRGALVAVEPQVPPTD